MNKPKHKYNLRELEDKISESYAGFEKEDNQRSRTQLYLTIKNLAYAVLEVGRWNSIDYEEVSYEYAVYLFERIALGKFKPRGYENSRFPWQHYIRKNIRHIIMAVSGSNHSWYDLVEDLERFVDEGNAEFVEEGAAENHIGKDVLATKLFRSLTLFYDISEIRRLLAISVDLLSDKSRYTIRDDMPPDVKEFSMVLVAMAKRIASDSGIKRDGDIPKSDLLRVLSSSVRSTVFLSTIVNCSFFPKELLLALDIDSLYRLVQVMEGRSVRVPTLREMDTIIGSVIAISNAISEGGSVDEVLKESKEKYGLVFSNHVNMRNFISKSIETYDIFGDMKKPSEPIIKMLLLTVNSLEVLFSKLNKSMDDTTSSDLLDSYKVLSESFNAFTKNLINISDRISL